MQENAITVTTPRRCQFIVLILVLLSASLVGALVQQVVAPAEQEIDVAEQLRLIDKVYDIDAQIATSANKTHIEMLESQRQSLFQELLDNVSHVPLGEMIMVKTNVTDQWR